ncbi:MAG: SIS domain-containing protein [Candidatus Hermodarchaeota archaeon]
MKYNEVSSHNETLGNLTEKEIFEIPNCLKKVIEEKELINKVAKEVVTHNTQHIFIIGAGSSYHAGFAMSYMFNRITNIPTFTEFAMEFQYLIKPILHKEDCIIGVSQSGETKDTIETIKIAKDYGCLTIGITNNLDSTLAKLCDLSIFLKCGDEKAILATKTYVSELAALSMLSLEIAKLNKSIPNEEYNKIWVELIKIPDKINSILLNLHEVIKKYSQYFKFADFCFIIGSGPDFATAMEASLKLKEGARIFGQAYSTAEFPHGPITLADSRTWILAIIPHEEDKRKKKLINLLKRIKERKATILGIYESTDQSFIPDSVDFGIQVPNTILDLQPLLMILGVQLLTLEIARIKGINCDTPKYLSKVSEI